MSKARDAVTTALRRRCENRVIFTDATDERGPGVAFRKPTAR